VPQPILRHDESLRKEYVVFIGGTEMWNAPAVSVNLDGLLQTGKL
jgi:hypothetical protein